MPPVSWFFYLEENQSNSAKNNAPSNLTLADEQAHKIINDEELNKLSSIDLKQAKVYDAMGRFLFEFNSDATEQQFNNLASGIYFIVSNNLRINLIHTNILRN